MGEEVVGSRFEVLNLTDLLERIEKQSEMEKGETPLGGLVKENGPKPKEILVTILKEPALSLAEKAKGQTKLSNTKNPLTYQNKKASDHVNSNNGKAKISHPAPILPSSKFNQESILKQSIKDKTSIPINILKPKDFGSSFRKLAVDISEPREVKNMMICPKGKIESMSLVGYDNIPPPISTDTFMSKNMKKNKMKEKNKVDTTRMALIQVLK